MKIEPFIEKVLIGFLPEEFQKNFEKEKNIKIKYMTFLSAIFSIIFSLVFWFSFFGFYLKFKPGIFWIIFVTAFFSIIFLDGLIRILFFIFKRNLGSLPFFIFYKYLSKLKAGKDFFDDILEFQNVLIIHSPCPKPHWLQWGGIYYNNKSYKISKHLKLEISQFFKFEVSNEKFPDYNLEKERSYNISSDFSLILSPIWGFLPEKYQYSLLKYKRYNIKFFLYFSIILTFFVSFPSLIFDLIRIMQKGDVLFFIIPHFLLSLYFVYESLMRFLSFIAERKIKGSLLAFFIKPLYYMIYGELL